MAEAILIAAADHDALSSDELSLVLEAQRRRVSGDRQSPRLNIEVGVDGPAAVVGAPAHSLGPSNTKERVIHTLIPEHYEVANAFGAAIGDIRLAHQTTVSAPRRGLYRVHTDEPMNFYDLKTAQRLAEEAAESRLRDEMQIAGGQSCKITHSWTLEQAIVEDRELFVEGTLNSVALGNP